MIRYVCIVIFSTFAGISCAFGDDYTATRQFELRLDTDIRGSDILSPLGHPDLRGITMERCAAICLALKECVAFTFNEKARVCFPKQQAGGALVFPGAISGVRLGVKQGSVAENDFSPYLSRASCATAKSVLDVVARDVRINYPVDKLTIHTPARVAFRTPKIPKRYPAFLILTFDQPVRFRGKGFYVLAPHAIGPFGSKFQSDRTRVIIPLFARSEGGDGDLSFVPLLLSRLQVSAAVVAQSECGEQARELAHRNYDLPEVKAPKIFVFDPFGATAPNGSFASPKGDRHVDVYGSYFRLVSSATNAPIAEIAGRFPRFSPSGRFVTAEFANGVRIFDAVDGEPLGAVGYNVGWDVGDSFVLGDTTTWGKVIVRSTLVEPDDPVEIDHNAPSVGIGCHSCQGVHTVTLKIDLENNFLVGKDGEGGQTEFAISLTSGQSSADGSAIAFISANAGIVPVKMPSRWETHGPLRFTNLLGLFGGAPLSNLKDEEAHLGKHFLFQQTSRPAVSGNTSDLSDRRQSLLARLHSQYGITLAEALTFHEEESRGAAAGGKGIGGLIGLPIAEQDVLKAGGSCADIFDHGDPQGADSAHYWKLVLPGEVLTIVGFGCNYGTTAQTGYAGAFHTSRQPAEIHDVGFGVAFEETYFAGGGCGGDCGFTAQLISGRYILTWAQGNSAIALYDVVERKLNAFSAYRGRLIDRIYLTADHRNILQVNTDGTFAFYASFAGGSDKPTVALSIGGDDEVPAGVRILGHYDDDELVVWEPQGHFDAGYEATSQIFLKFDGEDAAFNIGQFASVSRLSGLFEQAMKGVKPTAKVAYAVPPIITVNFEQTQNSRIRLDIQQLGGNEARHALVYQDGVLSDRIDLQSKKRSWTFGVERRPDARWISVIVVDAGNLQSTPKSHDLGHPKERRNLRLLAVGIDEYADPRAPSLSFSKTDAFKFSQALQDYARGRYGRVSADGLADAEADKETIVQKITDAVSQSGGDADLIFYFSGHGLTGPDGQLYLALTDTDVDDLPRTALAWSEIAPIFSKSSARISIVLDTCHSGGAGRSMFATNDEVADALVNASSGPVTILSASKGRERSLEDSAEGGGFFTSALVEALAATSDLDLNKNGALELSEAYRSVKHRVSQKTGATQTPWLATNRPVGERPIF